MSTLSATQGHVNFESHSVSHTHEHHDISGDTIFGFWPVSYTHLTLPTTPYV